MERAKQSKKGTQPSNIDNPPTYTQHTCIYTYRQNIRHLDAQPRKHLHYALIVRGSKTLKSQGRPGHKRHVRYTLGRRLAVWHFACRGTTDDRVVFAQESGIHGFSVEDHHLLLSTRTRKVPHRQAST